MINFKTATIGTLALVVLSTGILLSCSGKAPKLSVQSADDLTKFMSLKEKALLTTGTGMIDFSGKSPVIGTTDTIISGAAGTTQEIKRLGIPSIVMADGPAGVRIAPTRDGDPKTYYATAFPIGTLLASSWDTEKIEQVGRAMGNEALEYGIDILLTPAINIHRNPLCGRNFEYYSEDPLVSGKIGAAMIRGIQSNGVGTAIKHFAANNQETNRISSDSRVTQRALREIYLKGFEIAVKEAAPWTVMTSYNLINGVHTPESTELLTDILRDEWGFEGLVMTDWFGGLHAERMIRAGNDLLMPGIERQREDIVEAVSNDSLDIKYLDASVTRILKLIVRTPRFRGYAYSEKPDLAAHAAIVRQAAAEGMVLLKNARATLPFDHNMTHIATYGVTSYDPIGGGTGSGHVNNKHTVSLAEGLEKAGYTLNKEVKKVYETYLEKIRIEKAAQPPSDNVLASFITQPRPAELVPESDSLHAQANTSDIAIITIGRQSGEMSDRTINNDFDLTAKEQQLIEQVTKAFHAKNKKVVVILNIGGVVETSSWNTKPDAILLAWQGGQETGHSIADILSGKVNPSGKLTMTFPIRYTDVSSALNFPYDYRLTTSLSESMTPHSDNHNPVRNVDYTMYEEDIYVGYRYFDSFQRGVSYPFGYGLSYTDFEYSNVTIGQDNDSTFTLSVTIRNTGKVSGKEVVQLYVTAPVNPDYPKPQKELKAFAKTRELASGASQTLKMTVTKYELASFDQQLMAWVTDSGNYTFAVGASSASIRKSVVVNVATRGVYPTHNALLPREPINVLSR